MGVLGQRMAVTSSSNRLPYFVPGVYPKLQLSRMFHNVSRAGDSAIIAEFQILESDVDERVPGTGMSQYFKLGGKAADVSPANVKRLCLALLGLHDFTLAEGDPNVEAFGEALDACFSDDNPLEGCVCRAEAVLGKTKDGRDFTMVMFKPLPDEEVPPKALEILEQIAEVAP